ncbi:DegT/DnrJ/EryC1/StrS family aminotransferase [Acetohalobium arabaticum]|uniref:DegT/DnrJ/EryC1/StrS aminotransferase n=1 Tax=Acetohalobium arabaticum (strain ATCC 49924 / DSM 5501 / Z-7288) TaxID=574087 RepID=D9QTB6_ACEAZ|nr:DegT/DnrJ/EryC1/StrS family aminotransferase [Acetohalobium arabaticum]ADL13616.1 DegT/DnrJ/EryC1/StrS aminotransferase [Acetohalobium arabaticum DSM 5501]
MKVPLLDLKEQYEGIKDEIQEAINDVLDSTRYIMGKHVEGLEEEVADYCDTEYGIGVASGTDALLLSLKALDIGPGDEVIVPTFTFFATAGVVSRLGATPVFADIDPVTYNITPEEIEDKITDKTKAIIPVHLYGQPAEMNGIMDIADRYDLKVVEDACQAIGAEYKGTQVGNFGDAAALSFFPSKNLGGYGDGGMVLTNDEELAQRIKRLRVHGAEPKYHHKEVGYNSRLDAIQAAVLRVKLKYLDEWTEGRQRVAETYDRLFEEYGLENEIVLPEKKIADSKHVYHQYVIRVDNRDELQKTLKEAGVSTSIYYPKPLHLQECYEDLGYQKGDLPVAEKACEEVLALPIDPALKKGQIKYVLKKFKL